MKIDMRFLMIFLVCTDHSPTHFRDPDKFAKKKNATFLLGKSIVFEKFRSEFFSSTKNVWTFLIEEIFILFRVFSYDLEIAETFENAITDALIRSPNLRLKKYVLFLNICLNIHKSQYLVQKFSGIWDGTPNWLPYRDDHNGFFLKQSLFLSDVWCWHFNLN